MKLIDEAFVHSIFRKRNENATKWDHGHALLICGSKGKIGAAILSSRACLRSGVGLLTVHIPAIGEIPMQIAAPEAMIDVDQHTDFSTKINQFDNYQVIGIGPGIGRDSLTAQMLKDLLITCAKPMVLDADALNILATNSDWLELVPKRSVLTPHERELKRLVGEFSSDEECIQKLTDLSRLLGCTVICKGHATKIALPDGIVYVNSTGNAGMAKAGMGDVLTGIITALIAQGYTPEESVLLGVYIHGLSGDLLIREKSNYSLLATDLIEGLSDVFKQLEQVD
jgi:NAD(P)H-hydrate epimerase